MFTITSTSNTTVKTTSEVDLRPRPAMTQRPATKEDFEKQQRKERAWLILGSYSMLMHYAIENNQSVPKTRTYFRKAALGIAAPPIIKNWFPNEP